MSQRQQRRRENEHGLEIDAALALLGDDYAQEILAVLIENPATAKELTERCPGSRVTIYRRLNRLEDAGLVETEIRIRSDGNHCERYRLAVEKITVSITEDGFESELRPSDEE
ncbi:ArsR/SmtB family transcription factor [Halopiger xanaduensis]|uniref:Transcriptional regulator TrmB n=1 Tax=Halopiger xanaduensis (strain DSM 18323 / JCM 14033 / SH-6) TaxID=797210 RepID=F8D6W6_HALXS|nr:winged helix-turn-helix domain-containing protein [Halopiger xanaduensis]AEH36056.1 transcriptional regulator TrmB [Halopiger xanaduensis SH-6]